MFGYIFNTFKVASGRSDALDGYPACLQDVAQLDVIMLMQKKAWAVLSGISMATVMALMATPAQAAEYSVTGNGTFKPPAAALIASLPAQSPFSATDLASGTLSFSITWDDDVAYSNADPYSAIYPAAITQFLVKIGNTHIALPVAPSQIQVSDGGFGAVYRESIRLQTILVAPAYSLDAGWVLINQQPTTTDLRGAAGSLLSGALPTANQMAGFGASGPNDKAFYLILKTPGSEGRPAIYINTSAIKRIQYGPASVLSN